MDRLYTSGEAAQLLGTSVPRVLRAARHGRVRTVSRGNRTMFDTRAVDDLRQRWGWAPALPGLRREEVMALATLGRHPLGLTSVRALARASGLSPTAAGRALQRLTEAGYVERRAIRVVEGRVRERSVWTVRFGSPEWLAVAAHVGAAVLPRRRAEDPPQRVPRRLGHLFWNENLGRLSLDRNATLVAGRILRSDDPEALAWMCEALPRDAIEAATQSRGIDARRARLGRLLAQTGALHVTVFEETKGRQTMEAYLGGAKLQILEASSTPLVEPTTSVAGVRVAGVGDLLAMKLKVVRERGELRDYFDLMTIERDAHRRVEEGIALALRKYRPRGREEFIASLLRSLAYLDDVEEDPAIPMTRAQVAAYWAERVPEITANLSRWG